MVQGAEQGGGGDGGGGCCLGRAHRRGAAGPPAHPPLCRRVPAEAWQGPACPPQGFGQGQASGGARPAACLCAAALVHECADFIHACRRGVFRVRI